MIQMLVFAGVGAETQRPLATVVGGMFTATALRLVLPLIYIWSEQRAARRSQATAVA